MSIRTALLDANVLHPAPVRDLLLQLAVADLYRAKWSDDIHREWTKALMRNEPHRDRAALQRTRALMDQATRDCLVAGYEALIPSLSLPDPDDRHVLAAAIVGRCDVIVTKNLSDFPEAALGPYNIEARHPDAFLCDLFGSSPTAFYGAVQKVRARLTKPPYSVSEYFATLVQQGLFATVAELERVSERE